jgi:hypothetical protein
VQALEIGCYFEVFEGDDHSEVEELSAVQSKCYNCSHAEWRLKRNEAQVDVVVVVAVVVAVRFCGVLVSENWGVVALYYFATAVLCGSSCPLSWSLAAVNA